MNTSFFIGDFARALPTEALIVPVDSPDGRGFGNTEQLIEQAAGPFFKNELRQYLNVHGLPDGTTLRVKGGKIRYARKFNDIIYIKDELKLPVADLVYRALTSARHDGYHSVVLPLFRIGVIYPIQSEEKNALALLEGIHTFGKEKPEMDVSIGLYPPNATVSKILIRHLDFRGTWDGEGFINQEEEA